MSAASEMFLENAKRMQKNFEGEIAELRLQMMKANQYVTHSSASLRVGHVLVSRPEWATWTSAKIFEFQIRRLFLRSGSRIGHVHVSFSGNLNFNYLKKFMRPSQLAT